MSERRTASVRSWGFVFALIALALGCNAAPPASRPSAGDAEIPLPELVAFPSGSRTLHGFLYRPKGNGPFRAVIYNHGSEPLPGDKEDEAAFYVSHGYALFVPHRRGQGASSDAGDYVAVHPDRAGILAGLVAQTDDVMAAVDFVRAIPHVEGGVVVVGCSFGGIVSLFAAERGSGIDAVIDFAGGAMSWASSPELRERMRQAAREAKVPVLFLQAANDFDTTPSLELSAEMRHAHKPVSVRILGPVGSTHLDGHHMCRGGEHPPWGEDVLAFIESHALTAE